MGGKKERKCETQKGRDEQFREEGLIHIHRPLTLFGCDTDSATYASVALTEEMSVRDTNSTFI